MPLLPLSAELDRHVAAAFRRAGLPESHAGVSPSSRPDLADWQVNGALSAAKAMKRPPRELAQAIADALEGDAAFETVSVAGPGFVNLTLAEPFLWAAAEEQLRSPTQGIPVAEVPGRVMIDFGGPNIAKPLHVGHLRSLLIGESIRRTLDVLGHEVISDIHLGDWGLQMGMLISELQLRRPELAYFHPEIFPDASAPLDLTVDAMEAMYTSAAAACKADPERLEAARRATSRLQAGDPGYLSLWRAMRALSLDAIAPTISELGAHFTLYEGEANVAPLIEPMVAELRERGIATASEGALVVQLANEDDVAPMPPLLLMKRDGAALYATTDLATIRDRQDRFHPATILYVVDARQSLHFDQVFRAARIAGFASGTDLVHIGFGTVNGADNRPYKTRDGGVMRLDELIGAAVAKAAERVAESEQSRTLPAGERAALARQIGIAAVKYADLSSFRMSGYIFDPDRMVSFEGKTGPYLQYACVRIASILAKAGIDADHPPGTPRLDREAREAVLECLRLPEVVLGAASAHAPNQIAEHAYVVAQKFNRFYANCPILGEPDPDLRRSRLKVVALVYAVLRRELSLLGLEVPVRM